jgi:hypothetical protein
MPQNLLIVTERKSKFLTERDNLQSLMEFAKTFNSEIYLVEHKKDQKVLNLNALTAALCDSDYKSEPECQKLQRIFPATKRTRRDMISEAEVIRKFIAQQLLSGKELGLKELKQKYKDKELTDACLCQHLSKTRKILSEQGYMFSKVSAGTYQLVNK